MVSFFFRWIVPPVLNTTVRGPSSLTAPRRLRTTACVPHTHILKLPPPPDVPAPLQATTTALLGRRDLRSTARLPVARRRQYRRKSAASTSCNLPIDASTLAIHPAG